MSPTAPRNTPPAPTVPAAGRRGPIRGRQLMSRILDKLARDAINTRPPLLLYGVAHSAWWAAQCHFFKHFYRPHAQRPRPSSD